MNKPKAQVTIEFAISFFCALLFLLATANIFVWFGKTIINRNKEYENSRSTYSGGQVIVPAQDFYNQYSKENKLKVFEPWLKK